MADRTGKFWWEQKAPISLQAMKGVYDFALSNDCRCGRECNNCEFGNCCDLRPWVVLCSSENWGEEFLNPTGLPDGDMPDPEMPGAHFDKNLACDIFGIPFYLQNREEIEKEVTEKIMEQKRLSEAYYAFIAEAEEEEKEFKELCAQSTDVELLTLEASEIIKSMDVALAMEIHSPEEISDYEYDFEKVPTHLSKSHQITSGLPKRKLTKKGLRASTKNGSYSHGFRGSDRYKDKRKGKNKRKSPRSLRDIAL
jgi:hypothetical protein